MYKIFLTFFLLYLSSCFLSTNLFIYYESNVLFLSSFLGAIKFRCTKGFFAQTKLYFIKYHLAFIKSSFLFFSNYYGAFKKKYSLLKKLNFIFNMLSYGFMIRFKVIGLGHRGYYTKGVYLFKLGYSHLVLYTLSFTILSSIKPKKHPFHRIWSINKNKIDLCFYTIVNMRIPDIYNLNGIFRSDTDVDTKEGRKSFML